MGRVVRLCLLGGALLILSSNIAAIATEETHVNYETVHTSNAAILNRLGLAPLRIPDGHHKKRLAGPEPPGFSSQTRIHQPYSRRHGHRDSHIYIVKLPASPPYYTIAKAHKSVKDDKGTDSGSNLPVGFHGNGKPAKIYHWNLPLVKKISEKKRIQAQTRMEQAMKKFEEAKKRQSSINTVNSPADTWKNQYNNDTKRYRGTDAKVEPRLKQTIVKHARNNDKRLTYPENIGNVGGIGKKVDNLRKSANSSGNKTYRLDDSSTHGIHLTNELHGSRSTIVKVKKHRKKAAMSYYAPITSKTGSTSIHKNFPGNGKPKAFYVMEKSRKPVYYHPLLP